MFTAYNSCELCEFDIRALSDGSVPVRVHASIRLSLLNEHDDIWLLKNESSGDLFVRSDPRRCRRFVLFRKSYVVEHLPPRL